jgi:hypothetical protein
MPTGWLEGASSSACSAPDVKAGVWLEKAQWNSREERAFGATRNEPPPEETPEAWSGKPGNGTLDWESPRGKPEAVSPHSHERECGCAKPEGALSKEG